jgi:integrase
MHWDGEKKIWYRMYRGNRLKVAVATLEEQGYPVRSYTQEGSYDAANQWYRKRRADIDAARGQTVRPRLPLEDLAAAAHGDPKVFDSQLGVIGILYKQIAERVEQEKRDAAEVRAADPEEGPPHDSEQALKDAVWAMIGPSLRAVLEGGSIPKSICDQLPPGRCQQIEQGIQIAAGKPNTPADQTVRAWADRWLDWQHKLAERGSKSAGRVRNLRHFLGYFVAFVGENHPVSQVTTETYTRYYAYLLERVRTRSNPDGWSPKTAQDTFIVAKQFIRYLVSQDACVRPSNFDERLSFGVLPKAPQTWTAGELHAALDAARHIKKGAADRFRLCLLLMANCGMTQVDIADLKADEVDWAEGRVTRRRSKTQHFDSSPTVSYKLWPTTWELLRRLGHRDGLVLRTPKGRPLRTDSPRKCVISDTWQRLYKKLPFRKPLKQLRKLGHSVLKGSAQYAHLADYFLAHAPATVADRHYTVDTMGRRQLFDEAILWLGRQLGQVPPEATA